MRSYLFLNSLDFQHFQYLLTTLREGKAAPNGVWVICWAVETLQWRVIIDADKLLLFETLQDEAALLRGYFRVLQVYGSHIISLACNRQKRDLPKLAQQGQLSGCQL